MASLDMLPDALVREIVADETPETDSNEAAVLPSSPEPALVNVDSTSKPTL